MPLPESNYLNGEIITLAASAARTAGANGTAVYIGGHKRVVALLNIAASATEAGDTLDVYIDFSLDGSTWYNGGHFTQQAGNGAAGKQVMVFDAANPGTSVFAVTSDAASGAVRPSVLAPFMRARWAINDGNANANSSHTFSVSAFAL